MTSSRDIPLGALRDLALRYGIQTEHDDMFGRRTVASADSLVETLRALGAPVFRTGDIPKALRQRELAPWHRGLEPVAVAWNGRCPDLTLRLEAARAKGRIQLRVVCESGEIIEWNGKLEDLKTLDSAELDGKRFVAKAIPVSARLPLGYHRFEAECTAGRFQCLLLAAPPHAYDTVGKSWGVFLPLYALHTAASWGAGDLSDLKRMSEWAAAQGGSVVATLPLLAAFLDKPLEISPYVPASRLFWNELYVDPRQSPEFEQAPAAARLAHAHFFQQDIEKLRRTAFVDHGRLMALKRPLLEAMARWLAEVKPERHDRFQEYVSAHPRLRDYAAFRAATEKQGKPWMQWPQRLRGGKLQPGDYDPAAEHYHLYAQWLAEEQMQAVAAKGRKGSAGLYLDFPLGVHPDSYDVWRERELFATGADAGAPPDSLFTGGQKWGFPPLHPDTLRETGYAYLIECLQHQFRHASWVRLDHVMGLHRLFWVPAARAATEGVYVRYHPEEWYAIVCLESQRAKTVVVGENLGTVPLEVTREMGRRGLKPMYVLQYEAQEPGKRKPLPDVPAHAAASLNTHDMPPFASYWKGGELRDLAELGVFDAKEARQRLAARRELCLALEQFFLGRRGGKGKTGPKQTSSTVVAAAMNKALEWLAASDAKLLLVNLEDLWLETEPQNVPGTRLERPNWQRKARFSFEQFTQDSRVTSLLRTIARLRSKKARSKPRKP